MTFLHKFPPKNHPQSHPGADELLVQDDPGHEVDEADAGGEQRGDLGGAQDLQGQRPQVRRQRPQQREQKAPHEEGPCKMVMDCMKLRGELATRISEKDYTPSLVSSLWYASHDIIIDYS